MEILSLIFGILGLLLGIFSIWQFSNGIKIGALQNIRTLINRMEEEKQKHLKNSPEWMAMHHTQQDLDTLFKNLQTMFKVSDKQVPLS